MFKLTIRFRLIVTIMFMTALLIGGGIMGAVGVGFNHAIIKDILTRKVPSDEHLNFANSYLLRAHSAISQGLVLAGKPESAKQLEQAENLLKQSQDRFDQYLALLPKEGQSADVDSLSKARQRLVQDALQPTLTALKTGNREQAEKLNLDVTPTLFQSFVTLSDQMNADKANQASKLALDNDSHFRTFVWIDVVGLILGLGAVAVWGTFLLKAISAPLKQILQQFDRIADGDLRHRLSIHSTDEMGQIVQGVEHMRQNLIKTVSVMRESSRSISASSEKLGQGNVDLSARTEDQAASLQETASSMEQLTSTVQQNADNARQANSLAVRASETAERGGQVVGDVVGTMHQIKDSSKKIVDIISVIDGIAFQTNILALNAAVEAARAGEQGRGFAVVATEVRSLAQRSANAAKEIKLLINDSVERVESGTRLVDAAGQTMGEVVTSIKSVADIMGEITAASAEQRDGITQVSQAVSRIDETTQQNATLVEESATAAQSLQEQASALNQAVSVFKIDETNNPTPPNTVRTNTSVSAAAKSVARSPSKIPQALENKSATKSAKYEKAASTEGDWEEF